MKILVLNYEFPPLGGGAAPVSYEIAKGYVRAGHSVDVVTMGFRGLPREEVVDGIQVFRVPSIRRKKELCHTHEMLSYVISAIFFLNKRLKTVQYDINHTHFIIPTGIVALWLKRRFGLKYVLTAHGSDVPGFNEDRFTLIHRFTRPLLRLVADNARIVISPSEYLASLIRKNVKHYSPEKLIVIPNGIDPERFKPKKKEKIIAATGRLLPRKGFQYLIEAVSSEDIGYEVHIAGDGPMRAELKKLAEKSATLIVFHGWLDNKSAEYKDLLAKAAIYCLPSLSENSSVALLEAMSAGCAIITTDVSGCPETVGEAGILAKPTDAGSIRDAISQLIQSPERMKNYSRKARQRIEALFNWDGIVAQYLKLLV